MYYVPYEEKIRKIAHVRDVIYKFRFLIIGVVALITGLIIAFLSVQGSIVNDVKMKSSYVYGESFSPSATAFMGSVEYEYCEYDTWTKEKPVMPGNYSVRAKSKNGFGKNTYGKEVKFRIERAPLTISVQKQVTYGENPELSVTGFVRGDRLDEGKLAFAFSGYFDEQPTVTLEKTSLVIVDENRKIVTRAYSVDNSVFETSHPITITPRTVVLSTGSAEREYDGTALKNSEYAFESSLAFEDTASVKCLGEITAVGETENEANAEFTDAEGRDVTKYYNVVLNRGVLSVLPRKITVTVDSLPDKIYDGKPTGNFTWGLTLGTLAEGEKFSAENFADSSLQGEWKTALNAGEYALCMREFGIENADGATTDNYAVTVVDGSFCIKQREITLLIDDLPTKVYDGQGYGLIPWRVDGATPLADGQVCDENSFACATLDGQFASGRSVGVYTLKMGNFAVLDEGGTDVTDNYAWTERTGSYQVTKRPVSFLLWNAQQQSKVTYDGQVYSPWYEIVSGEFVAGDYYYLEVGAKRNGEWSVPHSVGEYSYEEKTFSVSSDMEEGDMTGNYEVSYERKTLTIDKRPISFLLWNAQQQSKVTYDGQVYSPWYEVISGEFAAWDYCSLDVGAKCDGAFADKVRDAGEYLYDVKNFSVFSDMEEGDMSGNYEVSYERKTLTIDKRPYTLILPTYGTNDYTSTRYSLGISTLGELADGEYLAGYDICVMRNGVQIENMGFVRDAGDYIFTFLSTKDAIKICRSDDPSDDTTHNYELAKMGGGVTINPIPLDVTIKDCSKLYDAKPFRTEDLTITATGLIENETYLPELTLLQDCVDAGQYNMKETLAFTDRVVRSDGTDSSMNYIYTVQTEDVLVIRKRHVTMQIVDKSRPYDKTALTSTEWYIPSDCTVYFVPEHTVTLKTTGSITEPGKVINSKASVEVYEGDKPVTHNYVLTVNDGSLEVTKRAVTLAPVFVQWEYDGNYFNPGEGFTVPATVRWTNAEDTTGEYGDALYEGARLVNAVATWEENKYRDANWYQNVLQADEGGRIYEGDTDVTEKYFDVTYASESLWISPRKLEIVMHDIYYEEGKLVRTEKDFHIAKGTLIDGHTITEFVFGDEGSGVNYLQSIIISNPDGDAMCWVEFDSNGKVINGNNGYNYEIKIRLGGLIMVETDKNDEQQQTTE